MRNSLAIEQLRQRPAERPWLIPVRFDDCEIPDRGIGGGRSLTSIQQVNLFGDHHDDGKGRLVAAIGRILGPGCRTCQKRAATPLGRCGPAAWLPDASGLRTPRHGQISRLGDAPIPGSHD
jgi:hypothetical protein